MYKLSFIFIIFHINLRNRLRESAELLLCGFVLPDYNSDEWAQNCDWMSGERDEENKFK